MSRKSNDLRKVFLTHKKTGMSDTKIATLLCVSRQTTFMWGKMSDEELLRPAPKPSKRPSIDLEALKHYYIDNPFSFDWETGIAFGVAKQTIQKWRSYLKITRKVATTTYKDAIPELKKTLKTK
jgi:hypothetical protein